MRPPRQILLLVETSKVYGRGLLDGIGRYAMAHGQWSLRVEERGLDKGPSRLLRAWQGDGIIFRSTDEATVQAIRRKRVPAVDTNSAVVGHGFPLVYADEDRIAQLAATHFLERRFQHFGYCAIEDTRWVRWRREAYLRELARLGLQAHLFEGTPATRSGGSPAERRLQAWVAGLPKPIGVLAANDVCGTRLIAACREAGVRIPEEVAVLGVDNDEVICRLTSPPLSSIDPDSPSIGYRAAGLLDEMMQGGRAPRDPVFIAPRGVVTRQSTDTLAVADADLVQALAFIRQRASQGIGVSDVVRAVGVSRATLERKFAAHLATTPRLAIVRAQIDRVKCLLLETNYPLDRLAALTGYKSQSHLSVAFKREVHRTPGEFRAEHGRARGAR